MILNGAAPAFDLADGGLPLPLIRSLSVVALFQVFGALVFLTAVVPRAFAKASTDVVAAAERPILRLIGGSLLVGMPALLAWLLLEAGIMADTRTLAEFASAPAKVLLETSFGHCITLQLAALAATGVALRYRRRVTATLLAATATILQAGHGHAFSMGGGDYPLLLSDALHLLGGAVWLGGLVPLLLAIRAVPEAIGAAVCRCFSPVGKFALVGVAASAAYQGYVMAGGLVGLIGTAFGWVELTKLSLLAVLTAFALLNRYRFAPALLGTHPAQARRTIARSIALQTGAGVLVMLAAGLLSSLPPGMHAQPVWPFSSRLSLIALSEDPDLSYEVIGAGLALALAALAFALAAMVRRLRWPALGVGAVLAVLAVPHLAPLMIEAYPTSFYRSPTGFAATAIAAGAALYPANCAGCHGADGAGHGPDAASLAIPPADLTAPHLWAHDDGELFWWLAHGYDAPEGGLAMPGFADALSDDQRWDLIDYIRAHNAGAARRAAGAWTMPIAAPAFRARCPDGHDVTLVSLRGDVVALRFEIGAVTVAAADGPTCVASDPAVAKAYGVTTGSDDGPPPETEILIDANGWLRDIGIGLATDLRDRIRAIRDHPLPATGAAPAHHHMAG